eukprot:3072217-Pyramimonas_sp.AAC.1
MTEHEYDTIGKMRPRSLQYKRGPGLQKGPIGGTQSRVASYASHEAGPRFTSCVVGESSSYGGASCRQTRFQREREVTPPGCCVHLCRRWHRRPREKNESSPIITSAIQHAGTTRDKSVAHARDGRRPRRLSVDARGTRPRRRGLLLPPRDGYLSELTDPRQLPNSNHPDERQGYTGMPGYTHGESGRRERAEVAVVTIFRRFFCETCWLLFLLRVSFM